MRKLQFAAIAEESLDGIHDWTLVNYGPSQAQSYTSEMLKRCYAIAEKMDGHQGCRAAFAADLLDDLRFTRSGQHYIIFTESSIEVLIVDFLHCKSDIVGRLAKFDGTKT